MNHCWMIRKREHYLLWRWRRIISLMVIDLLVNGGGGVVGLLCVNLDEDLS